MDENKLNEIKKQVQQVANTVKKSKLGNALGAAKDVLKSKQFKKQLKRNLIMVGLQILAVMILISCLVSVFFAIKDAMVAIYSRVSGFISSAWQWMTDDYWIKLDEEINYVIDEDTGEVLGVSEQLSDDDLLNDQRRNKEYSC